MESFKTADENKRPFFFRIFFTIVGKSEEKRCDRITIEIGIFLCTLLVKLFNDRNKNTLLMNNYETEPIYFFVEFVLYTLEHN